MLLLKSHSNAAHLRKAGAVAEAVPKPPQNQVSR
jgi:hypothetical protein